MVREIEYPDNLDLYKRFYTQDMDYWYIPKRLTIKKDNWETLWNALQVYKDLESENFRECQSLIGEEFRKRKIDYPYMQEREDAANARMMKQPLEQLGLLYISNRGDIKITEVGEAFLQTEENEGWQKIIEKQLHKWQFTNPTVGRPRAIDLLQTKLFESENFKQKKGISEHISIKLFPYRFLIKVLLGVKNNEISSDEYILFLTRVKREENLNNAISLIKKFRQLSMSDKKSFIEKLRATPVKGLMYRGEPLSMYDRIKRNSSYSKNFLNNGMLIYHDEKGNIKLKDPQTAFRCVANNDVKYIDYADDEDWMFHYGSLKEIPSFSKAVKYYEDVGFYEKAADVVREVDKEIPEDEVKKKVKKEIHEYLEVEDDNSAIQILLEERVIEDYLEKHIDKISSDLSLLEYNGKHRQVDLPLTGWNVDLLAKDSADNIVVIELKRRKGDDETIGQILRYMGWFVENEILKGNFKSVKGVIVANEETEKLQYAIKGTDFVKPGYVRFRQFTLTQAK